MNADNNILVISPPLMKKGVLLNGTLCTEILYIGQYFHDLNYNINVLDAFAYPSILDDIESIIQKAVPKYIIMYLWKSESLSGNYLESFFESLEKKIDRRKNIKIILIGSIASSLGGSLIQKYPWISSVVGQKKVHYKSFEDDKSIKFYELVKGYHSCFPNLTEDFLKRLSIPISKKNTISLYSSRGCKKRCSFCSYNAHLVSWKHRDIKNLANEIMLFNKLFGSTNFSLSDNNFGTDIDNNLQRLQELKSEIEHLKFKPVLALNISTDGLSIEVLNLLKDVGVNAILIGLETFNQKTLKYVYTKKQDIDHAKEMVLHSEKIGITPILSYILFHPWLSFEELVWELKEIEKFGVHKLVHFLSQSIVQVVPGTLMEKKINEDGLLLEKGFDRDFRFKDPSVDFIYKKINRFFNASYHSSNKSISDLADLKIREWNYIKNLVLNNNIEVLQEH